MTSPTARLKREAKAVMEANLERLVRAKRVVLEAAQDAIAQAAPSLALLDERANAEIKAFAEKTQVLEDALSVLNRYRSIPEIAPFVAALEMAIPIMGTLTAAAQARRVLAAATVPDPISVSIAVVSKACDALLSNVEASFNLLFDEADEFVDTQTQVLLERLTTARA